MSIVSSVWWCPVAFLVIALSAGAHAAEYYVDPASASDAEDGSRAAPWRSLKAVIDSDQLAPGDTVWLASSDYGSLAIEGKHNAGMVTISAEPGRTPRFSSAVIAGSSNWRLRGLRIGPVGDQSQARPEIVLIGSDAENIVVEDCAISSAPDISGWSAADWRRNARDGIIASGRAIALRDNRITNVRHGIEIAADDSIVESNVIKNFSGDGMRGLGNRTVYRRNTIKDCYKVDAVHNDGFQSWTRGLLPTPGTGEIVGGVLSGNLIINYEDPNRPLQCALHGIGMFDGMFVDWVIENNVVIVDHWHGITVMGARNVRIINNTVIDPNPTQPGPPWISITNHKDGRPSADSLIANNLTEPPPPSRVFGLPRPGVETSHNLTVDDPDRFFVDAAGYDLRLRPGSPAIDAGAAALAPTTDIEGTARPQGAGVDVGAYESR